MHLLIVGVGFGITSGAILTVSAVGFSLQFGMTNILNLAYGTVMTAAALTAYMISAGGTSIWIGSAAGAALGALVSLAFGRFFFRPFARRGARIFEMAMVTVAIALIGDNVMGAVTRSQILEFHFAPGRSHNIGGMTFTTTDIIIIVIAVVSVACLEAVLHRTRLGVAIRASSANAQLARASGINTEFVVNTTWLISGLLCGLSGVILALSFQSVAFNTGTDYLPYVFAVVIVAGIGSLTYAIVVSMALEFAVQIAGAYGASSYNIVVALGLLLAMLLIRPQGLFGQLFEKREVAA